MADDPTRSDGRVRLVDSSTGEVLAEGLRWFTEHEQAIKEWFETHGEPVEVKWGCNRCGTMLAADGSDGPYFAYDPHSDSLGASWCRFCAGRTG